MDKKGEKKVKRLLLGVLVLALAFLGCSKEKVQEGQVLAQVNDARITLEEFKKEITNLPPGLKPLVSGPEGQKRFLEDMIKRELLLQEAGRRRIEERPEVRERLSDFKKRLLLEALITEEIEKKAGINDEEVRQYYDAHPEEFRVYRIRARHILVNSEKEAKEVQARLKGKEKFEDLARKLSRDEGSREQGGDLGYFSRGQMVPEFERAAFSLKPGEVSGIVKTPYGYHLIKMVDRQESGPYKFEEVKERLKQRLLAEKQKKRFEEWMTELRSQANVKIEEGLLPIKEEPEGEGMGKGPSPSQGKE